MKRRQKVLTRRLPTRSKRVSNESSWTATDGIVGHHITSGIDTTHSHTWVGTSQVDTGQVGGTLTVDNTFWSAVWRSSIVA